MKIYYDITYAIREQSNPDNIIIVSRLTNQVFTEPQNDKVINLDYVAEFSKYYDLDNLEKDPEMLIPLPQNFPGTIKWNAVCNTGEYIDNGYRLLRRGPIDLLILYKAASPTLKFFEDKPVDVLIDYIDSSRSFSIKPVLKVKDCLDYIFSHNELVAIWTMAEDEDHITCKQMLWSGMAHSIPVDYLDKTFIRIFGTIPEEIYQADTINILI